LAHDALARARARFCQDCRGSIVARTLMPQLRVILVLWLALAGSLSLASSAFAASAEPAATTGDEPTPPAPDSPRAAVTAFLQLCDRGRYEDAAAFLELPRGRSKDGPELARRLDAVLDRRVLLDLDTLSPLSTGDTNDALPKGVDQVAEIAIDEDIAPQPVRVARSRKKGAAWVFTRDTVEHVDDWYIGLEDRWLLETLPAPLLRMGPRGLLWWQWIALPCVLFGAWICGWFLSRVTRRLAKRPLERTASILDDQALVRLSGPITLFWALVLSWFGIQFVHLLPRAEDFAERIILAGYLLALFWALFRLVDVFVHLLANSPWSRSHVTARSQLPLLSRVAKITLFAIGLVALLAQLGYPIASLLAGLGIGGLALALAAQKTVENLFGAFSIGADQPFREGDFVRVEDFVATVELIGLRSTRFRTLDRTAITIPNGKLAEMRLETFAVRDRLRLSCILGLEYGTTEAQMRRVLAGFGRVLDEHPKSWRESKTVRFVAFGASSLDIEIMAWFETSDWSEFLAIREEVLLAFMAVVQDAGAAFAFPTRTVHLRSEPVSPAP
jgi:MscS family membrane protein